MRNTTRTTKRQRYVLLAVVALLALLTASCGAGTTEATASGVVASISDDTGADSPDDNDTPDGADRTDSDDSSSDLEAPENPEDAFELFDQCLEEAGFGGAFSVDAGGSAPSGSISISSDESDLVLGEADPQQGGTSFEDFDIEEFTAANEACNGHLASIDQGFDMSPEQQAQFEDAQLEFSACMKDLGLEIPEFDGGAGGGIVIIESTEVGSDPQTGLPSIDDFDFEAFNEAAQECNHVFEDLEAETAGGQS